MVKLHYKVSDYDRKKLLNNANNYINSIESAVDYKDIIFETTKQAQYVITLCNRETKKD